MNHTEKMLAALMLANPFALLGRYDDDLAHCFEASTAATLALKARGVKARVVPCAVMAHDPVLERSGSIGLTTRDLYARVNWGGEPPEPHDEWVSRQWVVKPDALGREHIVIEVRDTHARYLVDLTIGQLRVIGLRVPLHLKVRWDQWPSFEVDGIRIIYEKFRGARELDQAGHNFNGFRDDYLALMDLAVESGLDTDRYFAAIEQQDPQGYRTAIERLNRVLRSANG